MKIAGGFGASELFQFLRDGEPRTRAELAQLTGLARSTISLRIDELLEHGLVTPVGEAVSTGGRPPAQIALNPGARVVVAADLGATHGRVAITDLSGTVLRSVFEDLVIDNGPEVVLDWLVLTINRLMVECDRPISDLVAVGIGLPGPVEHESGRPTNPPIMPGWDGYDVPAHMRRTFSVPILVDNDVNIMALGERAMGWPDADNIIFVKVSTGIGLGIIGGGVLQRGAQGIAGDIGHVKIPRGAGVVCKCGNEGCLEAIAGSPAIIADLRGIGRDITTVAELVALVKSGDTSAIQAVRQAGRDIGEVLTVCVSIINPSVITIGGALAQAGEHIIAGVREVVYSRSTPFAAEHLSIVQSRAGEMAGVAGASIMAIERALSPEGIEGIGA
ncbi:ROK family transcriptional regulator [Frigoribacterium sp. CG_9.8]|uniref:ROK family transcriptional regulator n=1 Tax=Frigoribacterium sp. CG_9.8 TaxID=2787733 RepID=UPI001A314127|nr:glucokinase [Frigoribacterium sp. CG_9.8]